MRPTTIRSMSTTEPSTVTSSGCARNSGRSTRSSTPSKPSMASATATENPERESRERVAAPARPRDKRSSWLPGSRLGRLIVVLNLLGLAILISGALVLNELRRGLVNAQVDSLRTQGELIANVIDQAATVGEPEPALVADDASNILQSLYISRTQRVRL